MLKLRLLKLKSQQVFQQLEAVDLPSLSDLNELDTVAFAIGKLLNKYSELINDSSMISSLLDANITDWTIRDIESIQANLVFSNMLLTISEEDQDEVMLEPGDVIYLMLDSSVKVLGVFPRAKFQVVKAEVKAVDLVEVYKNLLTENYFDESKFRSSPLKSFLSNLEESKALIGAYDQYSLGKLNVLFYHLNKTLLIITVG